MSTTPTQTLDSTEIQERIRRFQQVHQDILTQVHRVIVGQEEVIEQVLVGLFVGGHCLITGLPGTAKTLLVRTLATITTSLILFSLSNLNMLIESTL